MNEFKSQIGIGTYFQRLFFCFSLSAFTLLLFSPVIAQDSPQKEFPPPLKLLTKDEKSSLEAQTDVKRRTVLSLELMDMRLLKAEDFNSKEEFREMFTELGSFHALMDNTLTFLSKNKANDGKVLNNYKRIELSLRKYITRLELIRRDLPLEYEPYVRRLTRYVREARTKAVEPLFGETVLPGNGNEK
jgi:hypothetical protein